MAEEPLDPAIFLEQAHELHEILVADEEMEGGPVVMYNILEFGPREQKRRDPRDVDGRERDCKEQGREKRAPIVSQLITETLIRCEVTPESTSLSFLTCCIAKCYD